MSRSIEMKVEDFKVKDGETYKSRIEFEIEVHTFDDGSAYAWVKTSPEINMVFREIPFDFSLQKEMEKLVAMRYGLARPERTMAHEHAARVKTDHRNPYGGSLQAQDDDLENPRE
jgi:hypothetical protein